MAVAAGRSLDLSLFISLPDCSCNALPGLDQRSFKFSEHWQPSETDIRNPIKHGRRRHWRHWIVASNGGLSEIEFVDTSIRPTCSNSMSDSFVSDRRNVTANAGRSKAKKGRDSGGRIEGKRNKQGQSPDSIAKTISKGEKQASPKKANLSVEKAGMFESVGIRQPDDYYKYGPYGPHAWKGIVVGKPIPGTFVDQIVVMFSTVKDEEEHEKIAKYDACVSYTERLKHLDANVGIKYFYVFVRASHRLGWQAPWKEWTLVAQVAVESAEDLDKLRLGRRLDKKAMSAVTQCAAWFRPDLIYVKKPKYQVRFEPQEEFILGLLELLDPEKETKVSNYIDSKNALRSETYYGRLCDVLGVSENTNEKAIVEAFENMDDEGKSSCVEHILCSHPIQLLHPIRRTWNTREKQTIKGDSATHEGGITVVVQNNRQEGEGEGEGESESESENENDSMCSEVDENDFMKEDMMPLFEGKNQFGYESDVDNEHVSSAEQDFSGEDYNGEQWETYGDYSNMADESDGEGWGNEPSVPKGTDEDEETINGNSIRKAVDQGYGKTENFRVQGQTNPSFRKKKTQREDNMEDDIEESVFDGDIIRDRGDAKNTEGQLTGYLKSAIRPFTYLNMLKEIVLIRRNFVAYR